MILLMAYFGSLPHAELMQSLARRIVDACSKYGASRASVRGEKVEGISNPPFAPQGYENLNLVVRYRVGAVSCNGPKTVFIFR